MAKTEFILNAAAEKLAYVFEPGRAPCVVFLSGYRSDMSGTKAQYLADLCRAQGYAMLRFDYSGHGLSSGQFENGSISAWTHDTLTVIKAAVDGPLILIGSSMGGWIMLLVALARSDRIAGLVGTAAAPDFTEDLMQNGFSAAQKRQLESQGFTEIPNCYDGEPYKITQALLDDGRSHLLLHSEIPLDCPVRLIHGTNDEDVPWQTSLKIAERLRSQDVETLFVKNGDHRLSEPEDLNRLCRTVGRLLDQL